MRSFENGISLGLLKMALEEAIRRRHRNVECSISFTEAACYRMYYQCVAFRSSTNYTLGEMLDEVDKAIGSTYQGWKGGYYTMTESSEVFIANEGDPGWPLTEDLLRVILRSQEEEA